MNRADFMGQLESLLRGIAPTEREEAIQYYNDYFDDAGQENEQRVIEALGNPARVVENIRRDLLDNGYGKKPAGRALASDRALMEYGQEEEPAQEPARGAAAPKAGLGPESEGFTPGGKGTPPFGRTGENASRENAGRGWNSFEEDEDAFKEDAFKENPFKGYGKSGESQPIGEDAYRWERDTAGWFGGPQGEEKGKRPVWATALLATVLVLLSPVLGSLLAGLVGLLLGWFCVILGFGVAALGLLAVFLGLAVLGIGCFSVDPWAGIALIGCGLLVGCLGILFLMLTVAMGWIVTPAIFRGISAVPRFFRRKKTVWAAG